ncbi:MAG: glycerophosphodiester phosphodiesterase family protein [Propionibacteriaceae bacterium]
MTATTALLLGGGACTPGQQSGSDQPPPTVSTLIRDRPFYIAHRGGGGDWPELTAYAYEQAAKLPGLRALEFSVCQTADGVLVCSHDKSTERATGTPYVIAEQTWQTLSTLMVSARETNNPSQPAQPFTRFDDVIDRYVRDFVVFVEPKDKIAASNLMAKMISLGQPERVVWKQPINSSLFATAKQHGFGTWGYVLNEPGHLGDNLARFAASSDIDMLGAPRAESDAFVADIVAAADAHAKTTIMWEIRDVADRARALRLGCAGQMTSHIAEVLAAPV